MQNRFYAWHDSGLWGHILSVLGVDASEAEGREAAPTAVIRGMKLRGQLSRRVGLRFPAHAKAGEGKSRSGVKFESGSHPDAAQGRREPLDANPSR